MNIKERKYYFLPEVNYMFKKNVKFFDYTKDIKRVAIDTIDIVTEGYEDYLSEEDKLKVYQDLAYYQGLQGIFRIYVDVIRWPHSFCAIIEPNFESFKKGLLILDDSYHSYQITLTNPTHLEKAERLYKRFCETLNVIERRCPLITPDIKINDLCQKCIDNVNKEAALCSEVE